MTSCGEALSYLFILLGIGSLLFYCRSVFGARRAHEATTKVSLLLIISRPGEPIEWFVRSTMGALSELSPDIEAELVIVDSGSGVETRAVLQRLESCYEALEVYFHDEVQHGCGETGGLEVGLLLCRYPIVVTATLSGEPGASATAAQLASFVRSW
jgi:hypothetical protein